MKIETKRKILWWVKRVLNYCEYADKYPYIVMDQKRIVKVRSEHRYLDQEFKMIDEKQVRFASQMQIMEEFEKNKIIRYTQNYGNEYVSVVAEVNVIAP